MSDSLPDTMSVVEVSQPGGPEVLKFAERPLPDVNAGEVLIKVAACGMNRADSMQRNGKYPPPPGASDLLGLEVSGTIVAKAPDVESFEIGDEICALITGGGYAEYCTAAATSCLRIPPILDFIQAAGVPETFLTVWTNVFMQGNLTQGESILIHGGSSGIGTTAIQLASAMGAEVLTTAGSDDRCRRCEELGATHAINYKSQDFVEAVKELTNGKGVDLVLDIIAGDYVARNLKCLAKFGRLVIIATQGGFRSQINVLPIMQKRLTITGSTLRPRTNEEKAEIVREVHQYAWPLLEYGTVQPIIDSVHSFDNVVEAHEYMETGEHFGKIILDVSVDRT